MQIDVHEDTSGFWCSWEAKFCEEKKKKSEIGMIDNGFVTACFMHLHGAPVRREKLVNEM